MKLKLKPVSLNENQLYRISAGFVLALLFLESFTFRVNYSEYVIAVFNTESIVFASLLIISTIAAIYLFFRFILFSLSANWYFKTISFVLFFLFVFIEYSYSKALGRFSEKFDIESVIATNTQQQISSFVMYISFLAILPVVIFLLLLIFTKAKDEINNIKRFSTASISVIAFLLLFQLIFSSSVNNKFPTVSFMAFGRTGIQFLTEGPVASGKWASSFTGISISRRMIPKPDLPENYAPNTNIIVIVDESVRGDHLSINGYARKTTPFLEKLEREGKLFNWGIASSASTVSRFSYGSIITGLTPADFPDHTDGKINTFPTVFQYAKAMNYKTYFFDSQMESFWGGIEDDKKYLDQWITIKKIKGETRVNTWDRDLIIAKEVNQIINSSQGNFIFIFKQGAHIPYDKNFPKDSTTWKPSYVSEKKFDIPKGEEIKSAVNAYDNSIVYNLNNFFQVLVDDYSEIPNNTTILYTSDHGQTLFFNGKASHGGITKAEANVPLFIIGDLKEIPDTSYNASHQNLYPTILDLIDYPQNLRERKTIPSLLKAKTSDSKPRFYTPMLRKQFPFD